MNSTLAEADAQTPYTAALSATGGIKPYRWSLVEGTLPSGIQLQAASGTITGLTAFPGSYPFTAKVIDSDGEDAALPLVLTVAPTLAIVNSALAEADASAPYTAWLSTSGGVAPYSWSLADGALPPGIQLQASSGTITGLTAFPGSYSFTAKATDSYGQTAALPLILTVSSTLAIASSALAEADANAPYAASLVAAGGVTPYQWSLTTGTLPSGIELQASSGAIVGMTALSGSYPFIAQVTDSYGQSATLPLALTVSSALAITSSTLAGADANTAYSASLSATGGVTPYQWSLATGTLPSGIQLQASTGTISGLTEFSGSYPVTAKVTDSYGQTATLALVLTVFPIVPPTLSVQLPEVWVNNNEGESLTSYEFSLPSTWETGPAPSCTFHTPYWSGSPTQAGLQSALVDIEACRTSTGVGIVLDVPPALYTGASGIYIPQSSSTPASCFLVIRSTQDLSLPNGQTVCSHGTGDNLPTSKDIGIDNPDCAGDAMYYQLGTTVTAIPAGAFTLANGQATNTANYDDVQHMWTLEGSGTTPTAMRFCVPVGGGSSSSLYPACTSTTLAPDHWLIEDGEFRIQAGDTSGQDIVSMPGSGSETNTSQYPTHIHFRKDWAHGDWTSLAAGTNSVSDGFNLICQYCSIVDSQTSQSLRPGAEGHSVLMQGNQFKVDHNWFEGQSIGMLTGGNCNPWPIPGYVPFQDVEERRNRFTFPFAWLGVGTIPAGNTHYAGENVARKNANEMKSGQRVLRSGNIMENIDPSGGQGGALGDVKTANDSCGIGTNYQNIVSDVTDVSNIWRNSCEGIETIRNAGDVGGVDFGTRRWEIQNSLFYNTSETNFGCSENQGIQIDAGGWAWQGALAENADGTATFTADCSVNEGGCIGQIASATVSGCTGAGSLTFSAPNLTGGTLAAGNYGDSCVATITNPGSGYTSVTVTPTTGTATATINASSTAPGPGFTVLDMLPGDTAAVYQCSSVTSFNQPTTSYSSGYLPSEIGPAVSAGVNAASLTTTYAWPTSTTPSGSSDMAGYCKLTNVQSFPQGMLFDHNTVIQNSSFGVGPGNGFGNSVVNGPNFQQNSLWRDSIILGGGLKNSGGIAGGTATEKFNFDITSMSMDHVVWPTITASTMTEYGNNPSYPDTAGCTGGGCSPPTTMYFPATPNCTGATPTSSCVGFAGAMSASSMPLTLSDYHGFELRSDSVFSAGQSEDASDGTAMGANIPAIDAAQITNLYACPRPCGSPGPYPDDDSAPPN